MLKIMLLYTIEDLARGNRFIIFKRRLWWKKYVLAYLLLFGVGMIVFAYAQQAPDWRGEFLIIGIVALLLVPTSMALERLGAKLIANQIFKNNLHVHHPQTYSFEDENLNITGELFDANLKWEGFVEAAETDTDFFLFVSRDQAYVLPKRVFGDGQESLLRDFLKTKLQDRAKLKLV